MILIIDLNWKKDSLGYYEFVLPILAVAKEIDKCIVRHFEEVTQQDLTECDKVILCGTTLKDNAFFDMVEKFNWINGFPKPVLGICAGMEIIGALYGAFLSKRLEIGMTRIFTVYENLLFCGNYEAYSLHNFCVEDCECFDVLAQNEMCIQAIKVKDTKIYGVLFHPEVRNQEILKRFIRLIH
jgi:GMP synthase-like glutamine amidotransferase